MDRPFLCQLSALNTHPSGASKPFALARAQRLQQFVQKLNLVDEVAHSRNSPLSRVEFLGEMSDVLHSYAPLPLIPPTPFSHTGRRGSLDVLMAETGDSTQGLAQKSTPVRKSPSPRGARNEFRSTLCQQRASRTTRQTRTRVNVSENCCNIQRPNPHPSPFTLHPSTFNLQPSTFNLHPSPFTLHPPTFNLQPCASSVGAQCEGRRAARVPLRQSRLFLRRGAARERAAQARRPEIRSRRHTL